jgi:hypothetical protein
VKAIKTISLAGLILSASALGVRGGDGSGTLTISAEIRTAIAMFQEQKSDFLKKQREETKGCATKAREEIRDQLVGDKPATIKPLVQELRQSIEEAKRHAVEQNRKLVLEAAEAARTRRAR